MKKTLFIKNAALMTATALMLRFAGIIFKVWLARTVTDEGIGLYGLVFSVYVLASTFAMSGISTAVTRLTAESLTRGFSVNKILKKAIIMSLGIAAISMAVLFFGAEPIAVKFIGDTRAVSAIKIMAVALPFLGMSSCFRGYFIARRNATPSSVSAIIGQAVRIISVMLIIGATANRGLSFCTSAVMVGDVLSEIAIFAILFLFKRPDESDENGTKTGINRSIIKIALPITSGKYLGSILRTAENFLVVKCLKKYGISSKNSLSQFGKIKGMALPLLFFPGALLNSVSTLLIPEISESVALGRRLVVKSAVERVLRLTTLLSFPVTAIFFTSGIEIGEIIYHDSAVGVLLKVLAPIVPFMYVDSISDGLLKGLDQQNFCFCVGILDSASRILLVTAILPRFGMPGFVGIMYFSNALTCILNVRRLKKVSGAEISLFSAVFFPLTVALAVTLTLQKAVARIDLPTLVYIILLCAVSALVYMLLLMLFGIVSLEDIKNTVKN